MNWKVVFGSVWLLVGISLILCDFFWLQIVVSASLLEQFVGLEQLYIILLILGGIITLIIGPLLLCLILDTLSGYFKVKAKLLIVYLKFLKKLFQIVGKYMPDVNLIKSQNKVIRLVYSFRNLLYGLLLALILMLIKGSDEILYLWIAAYSVMKGLDMFGVLETIERKLFKRR